MNNKNSKILAIIATILLILILVIYAYSNSAKTFSQTNNPKNKKLVSCTATAKDPIQKVDGWITNLYPATLGTDPIPDPKSKTPMQPSYSISKISNKTETGNIFYHVEMANHGTLPKEMRRIMEVCNSDNKVAQSGSTKDTKTTGALNGVISSVTMVIPSLMDDKPGDYRIDAYLYINGKWTLTDRIDKVTFTK